MKAENLPRILLHAEGAAVLLLALLLYGQSDGRWWLFVLLLLAPDLAAVGYLVNARVGSVAYNAAHTYSLPIILGLTAVAAAWPLGMQLALIWAAHIGMDRLVGYGLKYPTGFKETHLNRI